MLGEVKCEISSDSMNNNIVQILFDEDTLQKIRNFSEEYNIKFQIKIKEDQIYFMFDIGEEIFKHYMFKKGINKIDLFWYYYIVEFIIGVTRHINEKLEDIS